MRFEAIRTQLPVGAAQSGSSRSGGGMEGTGRGSACPAAGSSESGTSVSAAAELAMVSQPCGTHVLQVGDALAGMEGDGCLRRSGNLNSQKRRNSESGAGRRYYILLIRLVSKSFASTSWHAFIFDHLSTIISQSKLQWRFGKHGGIN